MFKNVPAHVLRSHGVSLGVDGFRLGLSAELRRNAKCEMQSAKCKMQNAPYKMRTEEFW